MLPSVWDVSWIVLSRTFGKPLGRSNGFSVVFGFLTPGSGLCRAGCRGFGGPFSAHVLGPGRAKSRRSSLRKAGKEERITSNARP